MMIANEQEAIDLDSILYLLDNLHVSRNVNAGSINKALTNISIAQAQHYIERLLMYQPAVVSLRDRALSFICKSDYTSIFLSTGGFTAIYSRQVIEAEQREVDMQLQRANWIASTRSAKWSLRLSIIAILISIIALMLPYIVTYLSKPTPKPIRVEARAILKHESPT